MLKECFTGHQVALWIVFAHRDTIPLLLRWDLGLSLICCGATDQRRR
jgi:hypothetical protein